MSIIEKKWYLVVKLRLFNDNEPLAFSEGIDASDAKQNYRDQSLDAKSAISMVRWSYDRTEKLPSYPSQRL